MQTVLDRPTTDSAEAEAKPEEVTVATLAASEQRESVPGSGARADARAWDMEARVD